MHVADPMKLELLDSPLKFKGADVVIVDDMIDSGGTLSVLSQRIRDWGAARIFASAAHGLFTGTAMETIDAAPVDQVFVTDSLPLPSDASAKVVQISVAPLLSRLILAEHFRSISEAKDSDMFDNEDEEVYEES